MASCNAMLIEPNVIISVENAESASGVNGRALQAMRFDRRCNFVEYIRARRPHESGTLREKSGILHTKNVIACSR